MSTSFPTRVVLPLTMLVLLALLIIACAGPRSEPPTAATSPVKAAVDPTPTQERVQAKASTSAPTAAPLLRDASATEAVAASPSAGAVQEESAHDASFWAPEDVSDLVDLAPYEIRRFGRGALNDLAVSPRGDLLAVATGTGVWLHHLDEQQDKDRLLLQGDSVKRVVMVTPGGSVGVWNRTVVCGSRALPMKPSIILAAVSAIKPASVSWHGRRTGVASLTSARSSTLRIPPPASFWLP